MRAPLPVLLLAATACTSAPQDPAVEIGSGELEFLPLEDGQLLEVIQGPQGGFHLLTALRVVGIEPGDPDVLGHDDNPTITLDVEHDGESIIAINPITQGLDEAPASEAPFTHWMTNRFAILEIAQDDELDGETVALSVRIDDVNGVSVSDRVTLELFPHPDNQ